RKKCGATLEKIRERARERDQTADETGLAHSTPRRRIFANHLANLKSAPEDQSENESYAERGEDCLGRIFADVLFGIVLKCPRTCPRIAQRLLGFAARVGPGLFCFSAGVVPSLFGFATILAGNGTGRVPQILGRFACVHFAALEFVLRIRRSGRSM